MEAKNNINIRKYLVLLQDCMAIKFKPLADEEVVVTGGRTEVQQLPRTSQSTTTTGGTELPNGKRHDHATRKASGIQQRIKSKDPTEQSLKGLFLYKEFREINLQCFWNTALHETMKNLEYKGTVVPSTILVGFPARKHMIVMKTAWARKMLKSPKGYWIEFAGEIEELIADPIQKSHFIPLSDSLCWAIHEITSSGQEAFVDEILMELSSAFPETVLPSKELIYQVLERLTKERKVYQTSQGYFVVTPDTQRYITHTDPVLISQSQQSANSANQKDGLGSLIPQDVLLLPQGRSELLPVIEKDVDEEENDEDDHYLPPVTRLNRSHSLRNSMKRNERIAGCLPRRTFSMRSTKTKPRESFPPQGSLRASRMSLRESVLSLDIPGTPDQVTSRRRKHKSFLRKLLTFRRSKKPTRKEKAANKLQQVKSSKSGQNSPTPEELPSPTVPKQLTISTQTSHSMENLQSNFGLLAVSTPRKCETEDSDSGRYTESSSPHSEAGSETSPSPGCSRPQGQTSPTVSNVLGIKIDRESDIRSSHSLLTPSPSPCSLLSENDKWHFSHPSRSPSSMSSISSYRDIYNSYRRRNPPNYYNPTGSLNSNASLPPKPPSSFMKYPPRPFEKKQIYEKINHAHSSHTSTSNFKPDPKIPTNLNSNNSSNINNTRKNKYDTLPSPGNANMNAKPNTNNKSSIVGGTTTTTTTTTVTQELKNSTNLELELLLPLGKLISAALTDFEQKSDLKKPNIVINNTTTTTKTGGGGGVTTETTNSSTPTTDDTTNYNEANRTNANIRIKKNEKKFNEDSETTKRKQVLESKGEHHQGSVISELSTTTTTSGKTVNDLFTIKSFVKSRLNNSSDFNGSDGGLFNSTIEFKTSFVNTPCTPNAKSTQGKCLVETVSFKPFRFENECRESEII